MKQILKYPEYLISFLLFIICISRVIYFYNNQENIVPVSPDDAYYYIKLASNRQYLGLWTFDGKTSTTGFHLLHAYLLFLVFTVCPNIELEYLFLFFGILGALTLSTSLLLILISIKRLYGIKTLIIGSVPFFTWPLLVQTTTMMEGYLVILFSALTMYYIIKDTKLYKYNLIILISIGIFGTLSRSDYGALPGIAFITTLLGNKKEESCRAGIILAGAILGIIIVFYHNILISDHIYQASAEIKYHWSKIIGHDMRPILNLIRPIFFQWDYLYLLISIPLIILLFKHCAENIYDLEKRSGKVYVLIASAATIVTYLLFYRLNSQAVQPWYAANFFIPISLFISSIQYYVFHRIPVVILISILSFSISKTTLEIQNVLWSHQSGMRNAGFLIKNEPSDHVYGSWNAGIISYYSRRSIINLDGLVNDEVFKSIINNKLMNYLLINRIQYIVDYDEMLNSATLRIRGGYDDERVKLCLIPLKTLDESFPPWGGGRLRVFKVDFDCLKLTPLGQIEFKN